MKFKKVGKNEWGVLVVCPACKKKKVETSVRMHVYHAARAEVWNKVLGDAKSVPHANLYLKGTSVVGQSRIWKM